MHDWFLGQEAPLEEGMATHSSILEIQYPEILQYLCPGESHGQRSLVGYSSQGRKESDMTEANWVPILHFPYPMKHSTYICLYVNTYF